MTKEKEIREGVDKVIKHYCDSVCSASIGYKCPQKPKWHCEDCNITNRLLLDFKKDLSALGVVIKVDREFPKIIKRADWDKPLSDEEYATLIQLNMEADGYTAVEELIKK